MNCVDFSTLLASCIHDLKNEMGILISKMDEIAHAATDHNKTEMEQLLLQGKNVNDHLVQLLVLYRINESQYYPYFAETDIQVFLDETLAHFYPLFAQKHITLTVNCPKDLYWHLDSDLMRGAIGNIMHNLYAHARSNVTIAARTDNQALVIQIKDDGPGYPDEILQPACHHQKKFSFKSSNTGLGLYFSEIAAHLHCNYDKKGHIALSNNGINGGGCVTVVLP